MEDIVTNEIPLHVKAENMRKAFATNSGVQLISKEEFKSKNEEERRTYLAYVAIILTHIGFINLMPPKKFWQSAINKLIFLTEGFQYGNKAKKVQIKIGIMLLLYVLAIFFISTVSIWLKLLSVGLCIFLLAKLQNKWLAKVVVEYALASPSGLLNLWNAKLIAIHIISINKTYDIVVTDNLFEDIVLKVLAWDDLMTKQLVTRDEYFLKYQQ